MFNCPDGNSTTNNCNTISTTADSKSNVGHSSSIESQPLNFNPASGLFFCMFAKNLNQRLEDFLHTAVNTPASAMATGNWTLREHTSGGFHSAGLQFKTIAGKWRGVKASVWSFSVRSQCRTAVVRLWTQLDSSSYPFRRRPSAFTRSPKILRSSSSAPNPPPGHP